MAAILVQVEQAAVVSDAWLQLLHCVPDLQNHLQHQRQQGRPWSTQVCTTGLQNFKACHNEGPPCLLLFIMLNGMEAMQKQVNLWAGQPTSAQGMGCSVSPE